MTNEEMAKLCSFYADEDNLTKRHSLASTIANIKAALDAKDSQMAVLQEANEKLRLDRNAFAGSHLLSLQRKEELSTLTAERDTEIKRARTAEAELKRLKDLYNLANDIIARDKVKHEALTTEIERLMDSKYEPFREQMDKQDAKMQKLQNWAYKAEEAFGLRFDEDGRCFICGFNVGGCADTCEAQLAINAIAKIRGEGNGS